MASKKQGCDTRSIHFVENISRRTKAECDRRQLMRGSPCYFSEIVNESLDATLPQVDDEAPVVPIKKLKAKTRWKQSA